MKTIKLYQLKIWSILLVVALVSFEGANAQNVVQTSNQDASVISEPQPGDVPGAIGDASGSSRFTATPYPNPCKNTTFIKIENAQPVDIYVYVYDLTGKEVNRATYNHASSNMQLDLKQNGIYFMKVINGSNTVTQKIINE